MKYGRDKWLMRSIVCEVSLSCLSKKVGAVHRADRRLTQRQDRCGKRDWNLEPRTSLAQAVSKAVVEASSVLERLRYQTNFN